MTIIPPITGITPYLPAVSTADSTSALGQNLINAVTHSDMNRMHTTPSSFVQDTVSLSKNESIINELTGDSSFNAAYTAEGLMNAYYALMQSNAANDSFFQSDSNSTSSLNASDLSLPQTKADQNGTAVDTGSRWAKVLQQNPSMASVLTQSSLNQGIVNTLV